MSNSIFGPSGGVGGQPFDDEPPQDNVSVKEVRVWASGAIDSVQTVLTVDGETIENARHGGHTGTFGVVRLDDDEYITEIYGRYGSYVESFNIRTNKGQIRRFGGQGGVNEFLYVAPQGYQIVGFWGRASRLIDSIGVHVCEAD